MADPRFFERAGPLTLADLARIAEAEIGVGGAPGMLYRDVASLAAAGPEEVTFLDNRLYAPDLAGSRAGACILHPDLASRAPTGMAVLLTATPYRAYAAVAQAFHPLPKRASGIHAAASIDPSAMIGSGVLVEAGAVIGERAEIGEGSTIHANAVVGAGVVLGAGCVIGAGATLSHCILEAQVTIYPGARIGQDGFGFATDAGRHVKVPQLGRVLIGEGTEVGANTCIDRGSAGDTVIGPGCMIDNLVQIGHNVRLGRGCVIVAQAGISGSTRLDDYVVVGGQVGFAGHLHVGAGAKIAAQSGVHRDIVAGQTVGGYPAIPIVEWRRQVAMLKQMARKKGG
ncbi:MAG: UDP-3-O-(3-hydroxymyristoyl)glucosamine N-acyltransferase [Alphaproteobacteria bacterium]|nr:UDP-3-O-(3-hydroxymyristoyl)glucosamine N-acyltransferase [Alphaproteobacteria bacterium]